LSFDGSFFAQEGAAPSADHCSRKGFWMIKITAQQMQALAEAKAESLAQRLFASELRLASLARFRGYISEGLSYGIRREKDLAEISFILAEVDNRCGSRPSRLQQLLQDNEVAGDVKAFQVSHEWRRSR
jgi:hypothetical protein